MALALKGSDWSEAEVTLCVEAYFDLLFKSLTQERFVKAETYRHLSEITGRTAKSIEFKFQNISAVLDAISREWLEGLAPLANYQELLAKKVGEHIEFLDLLPIAATTSLGNSGLHEPAAFLLEAPPELSNLRKPVPDYIAGLARKFDPVARDRANTALGLAGEEFVFNMERRFLTMIDRPDLARNVRWISKEDGDGAGYDVLSFSDRGDRKFIEVKTTVGSNRTPFYLSRNEYEFSKSEMDHYSLVRLYNFRKAPKGFELNGSIDRFVRLSTEVYRAEF